MGFEETFTQHWPPIVFFEFLFYSLQVFDLANIGMIKLIKLIHQTVCFDHSILHVKHPREWCSDGETTAIILLPSFLVISCSGASPVAQDKQKVPVPALGPPVFEQRCNALYIAIILVGIWVGRVGGRILRFWLRGSEMSSWKVLSISRTCNFWCHCCHISIPKCKKHLKVSMFRKRFRIFQLDFRAVFPILFLSEKNVGGKFSPKNLEDWNCQAAAGPGSIYLYLGLAWSTQCRVVAQVVGPFWNCYRFFWLYAYYYIMYRYCMRESIILIRVISDMYHVIV